MRTGDAGRQRDGSYWNGCEHVGTYADWESAAQCGAVQELAKAGAANLEWEAAHA